MGAKQTKRMQANSGKISTIEELAKLANYSFTNTLNSDPDATENGIDHSPRQVFSGHYVPVLPTPIEEPEYVTHSHVFFNQLGFDDSLATSDDFMQMFSGNTSQLPQPLRKIGWATGYALSIYGTEYIQQCPFQTGNGYGDGRAVSVLEAEIKGQRYEMQLKGGGRTPYCRGADGRAVLRSSIREFLAQEYMHALGVPTSRSLSLYVSKTQKVNRPWYSPGSRSHDPDVLVSEPVAISTRVAPSFIRVGQLELFARRARTQAHPKAMQELEMIVLHAIQREYSDVIDSQLSTCEKVVLLAREFRSRLCTLVANWIRVGFCQGNFNSDNCAVGGYTLDYGPFGFMDVFNPNYQSWTGGGRHFAFLNQPQAAQRNFAMFCSALRPLLASDPKQLSQLDEIQGDFAKVMQAQMEKMWANKLGLGSFHPSLVNELFSLMLQTSVDYTIFFRQLSTLPNNIEPLKKSFYKDFQHPAGTSKANASADTQKLDARWSQWLDQYQSILKEDELASSLSVDELSSQMNAVNPKYSWREWFVAPAYQQASSGNYSLVRELQRVMTQPYAEQSKEVEDKYYQLTPFKFFELGGVSHYSCSS